jgi:hypothetical protein
MLLQVEEITAAIDQVQAALDSGEANAVAPAARGYLKAVTDASILFDKRRDAITGVA